MPVATIFLVWVEFDILFIGHESQQSSNSRYIYFTDFSMLVSSPIVVTQNVSLQGLVPQQPGTK